jgi:uncharacterized membrane protein
VNGQNPPPSRSSPQMAGSALSNIESVARLEERSLEQRSTSEHLIDKIADFVGSMRFVLLQVSLFVSWVLINAGYVPFIPRFDPYPYVLLTMIVSLESVLLATFVLIKQNRMSRRADQRDHLNLQIDLLAEKEITKMLQMQRRLCDHLGIVDASEDPEAKELSENTAVDSLAEELKRRLPDE